MVVRVRLVTRKGCAVVLTVDEPQGECRKHSLRVWEETLVHYAARKRSKPHPVFVASDKGEPISGERVDHGQGVGPCALTVLLPVRVFSQGELELLDFSSSCDIAAVQQ